MSEACVNDDFLGDVITGLSSNPRSLPCKYLYDAEGSALFEALCQTDDYYVTRADLALHKAHLPQISKLLGPGAHVIELGSGAGIKTRHLLESLDSPRAYTPIEISAATLAASARELATTFPDIAILPVQADYTQPIPDRHFQLDPPARQRMVYFPGSTISNFDHHDAVEFLQRMKRMAGENGIILIGVDLLKAPERLLAAYDDSDGVTARFNLNLLTRLVNELDAEVEVDAFVHEARFNSAKKRIEMHIVASRNTTIRLGNHAFEFQAGESIHTENSHKYSTTDFRDLAAKAGLESHHCWKDPEGLFSMHWLQERREV